MPRNRAISIRQDSYDHLVQLSAKLQIIAKEKVSLSFGCSIAITFFNLLLEKALPALSDSEIKALSQAIKHRDKLAIIDIFKNVLDIHLQKEGSWVY